MILRGVNLTIAGLSFCADSIELTGETAFVIAEMAISVMLAEGFADVDPDSFDEEDDDPTDAEGNETDREDTRRYLYGDDDPTDGLITEEEARELAVRHYLAE
jgi:hypothetical protein